MNEGNKSRYLQKAIQIGWQLEQFLHLIKARQLKNLLRNIVFKYLNFLKESYPSRWEVHHVLGTFYLHQKDFNASKEYYRKALKLSSLPWQKAILYNTLGNVYFNAKNYSQALKYYHVALGKLKQKGITFSNLAFTYEKLSNLPQAKKYAALAIKELDKKTLNIEPSRLHPLIKNLLKIQGRRRPLIRLP